MGSIISPRDWASSGLREVHFADDRVDPDLDFLDLLRLRVPSRTLRRPTLGPIRQFRSRTERFRPAPRMSRPLRSSFGTDHRDRRRRVGIARRLLQPGSADPIPLRRSILVTPTSISLPHPPLRPDSTTDSRFTHALLRIFCAPFGLKLGRITRHLPSCSPSKLYGGDPCQSGRDRSSTSRLPETRCSESFLSSLGFVRPLPRRRSDCGPVPRFLSRLTPSPGRPTPQVGTDRETPIRRADVEGINDVT